MSRQVPPSAKRVRLAHRLGVRPRSSLLVLAGLAWFVGLSLDAMPIAARWLSDRLDLAFSGSLAVPPRGLAAGAGVALLGLLCLLTLVVVLLAPRARARQALGIGPESATIPAPVATSLILAAAIVLTLVCIDMLAGAARSVDASTAALTTAWLAWVRRGLFALAGVAASVGVIERLVSARRIWRALHQTPAQARREARAAGRRA